MDDGFGDKQGRSYIKSVDTIQHNVIVNGYNGVWTIDHDDGRCGAAFILFMNSVIML